MKKLVAFLLALVMISTCSVGLASNSNITKFINNTLDALIAFNIDSQALQVDVCRPDTSGSGGYQYPGQEIGVESRRLGNILLQKKGGMYQIQVFNAESSSNILAAEFNEQLLRAQVTQQQYDYDTRRYKNQTMTFELRYEDIQEMIDNALSMVNMMGAMAGMDIDLDEIADMDFEAVADALTSLINIAIVHCSSVERDEEGNSVARICLTNVGLLEAVNEWLDVFLSNTRWQDAFVEIGKTVINTFGSMMGNIDEDMSIIGDLSLGDLLTRSGLRDAVIQLRDNELKQLLEQNRQNPETALDVKFAAAPNGDFAYLSVDSAAGHNRMERVFDARYEGSDLVIKLGTDGYEKVVVSSSDAAQINMEYRYRDSVYWTGYARQTGSGNNWTLEVYDTYSFRNSPNTASQLLFSVSTTGQQPFESLANAPDIQRITWTWLLRNLGTNLRF